MQRRNSSRNFERYAEYVDSETAVRDALYMADDLEFVSFEKSTRSYIAERLRELADQLEGGRFQPGEESLAVPETLYMKIELEEKIEEPPPEFGPPRHFEIEVELAWPVEWKEG